MSDRNCNEKSILITDLRKKREGGKESRGKISLKNKTQQDNIF